MTKIFMTAALASLGLAGQCGAESLAWNDAVAEALQRSPVLASSRLAVAEAEESVAIASSGFWPSLSAGAGLNRSGSTPLIDQPLLGLSQGVEADRSTYQGGLSASWNLFDGFGTAASRSEALKNLEASRASFSEASSSLLLSLRQGFSQLIYYQKNAALLKDLGDRYHEDTLYQELEFKSGRTPRWTFLKSQSDEAELKWQIQQNSLNLQAGQAAFAALLGRDPQKFAEIGVSGELQAAAPPDDDTADLAKISSLHPAVKAARAQMGSSQAALQLARASRYPSLSANGSYGVSGADSWGPSESTWLAGLSLNFNLFAGGSQEAAVTQAGLSLQSSRENLQNQQAQLVAALHKAWTAYRAAYDRIPVSKMAADAGQDRFATVQKLYESGRAAYLDYEQAESIYSQAQQQLLSSNLGALQAQYAYENALGLDLDQAKGAANP